MGRRALRKPPADLDLQAHLLTGEQLRAPFHPGDYFGQTAGLEVEVGSGKGLFLRTTASACPDRLFLGIEIRKKYAEFTAAMLAKHRLSNARILHGDAEQFFRDYLLSDTLEAVHIYFPDPWWKTRHHKRRIMNEAFLLQVVRTLQPQGRLHFWTDVAEYFKLSLALIASSIALDGPYDVAERPAVDAMDYRTHFERRTRLGGEAVYRAEFIKPAVSSTTPASNLGS